MEKGSQQVAGDAEQVSEEQAYLSSSSSYAFTLCDLGQPASSVPQFLHCQKGVIIPPTSSRMGETMG